MSAASDDSPAGDGHGQGGGDHGDHHTRMVEEFRRRFWVSLGLTVPILLLSPLIQQWLGIRGIMAPVPAQGTLSFVLSTAVFFYGGWPFLTGLVDELSDRQPGMMTLIALAICVAYVYSSAVVFGLEGEVFFWELATLIDIMLVGHWIEMRSVMGASRALEELVELMPAEAHLLEEDGSIRDVPIAELEPGDLIVVKPGEKVPADGTVTDGTTSVNEAMLTGESRPVEKGEGDEVIGGAVNGEAAVTVEVGKTGEESYLSQMIGLVEEAQESRSKTQDLANRAALWLTLVALTAGAVTFAAWWGFAGRDLAFSVERMVTVMVITCPHALGLAVPLVVAVSTGLSARNGLLVRDRSAFERARELDAVIFDKTGTLTEGRFGVTDVFAGESLGEEEVLRLAASLESRSFSSKMSERRSMATMGFFSSCRTAESCLVSLLLIGSLAPSARNYRNLQFSGLSPTCCFSNPRFRTTSKPVAHSKITRLVPNTGAYSIERPYAVNFTGFLVAARQFTGISLGSPVSSAPSCREEDRLASLLCPFHCKLTWRLWRTGPERNGNGDRDDDLPETALLLFQ